MTNTRFGVKTNGYSLNGDDLLNGNRINIPWLRDNCRCDKCFNHTTNQRSFDILEMELDVFIKQKTLKDGHLEVLWSDDHFSVYDIHWLLQHLRSENIPEPKLWSGDMTNSVAMVSREELSSDKGLSKLLASILKLGIGFVTDVSATVDATEEVVTRVGPVQRTLFGDMWQFSDSMDHADTAYSKQALGAHTDNTYFTEPAGLQIFHCLHHDGIGGETLLVDGFRAAHDIKTSSPMSFKCLSTVAIEFQYIEKDQHHVYTGPILHFHPNSTSLQQIRFNIYDRSPRICSPAKEVGEFYKSVQCLAKAVRDPRGEWWFKLKPGTMAFINNWRILHGRASYTGHRKIAGCYMAMGDLLSKARLLKLIL